MVLFPSALAAKDYLVSQIVDEAQREQVPLSDVERKMLYFTETKAMSQDMVEASDAFDRDYDQEAYEKKIAKLIRKAASRARKAGEYHDWRNAIRVLQKGDHYLLVMIRIAGLRPPHDSLKLFGIGTLIACALTFTFLVFARYNVTLPSRDLLWLYGWIAAASLAIGYTLFRWIVGAQRFDVLLGKLVEKVFRQSEFKT